MPYVLYPVPFVLCPVPCVLCPLFCVLCPVPCVPCPASCALCHVPFVPAVSTSLKRKWPRAMRQKLVNPMLRAQGHNLQVGEDFGMLCQPWAGPWPGWALWSAPAPLLLSAPLSCSLLSWYKSFAQITDDVFIPRDTSLNIRMSKPAAFAIRYCQMENKKGVAVI